MTPSLCVPVTRPADVEKNRKSAGLTSLPSSINYWVLNPISKVASFGISLIRDIVP